jgi:hypothetical protein
MLSSLQEEKLLNEILQSSRAFASNWIPPLPRQNALGAYYARADLHFWANDYSGLAPKPPKETMLGGILYILVGYVLPVILRNAGTIMKLLARIFC